MEVSQIYRQTSVKTLCNDVTLLTTVDLLEVELASRAQEDGRKTQTKEHKHCYCISVFHSKGEWQGQAQANLQRLHDRHWMFQRGSVSLPTP